MAKTRLSNATFVERGYGQVEPNHLSAQKNGRIYAQLPAASDIDFLENGQFVKYDYANGVVNFTGEGAWMLVYNEEQLYDEREQNHKHWVMKPAYDGTMYPRVYTLVVGDIYTTNMVVEGEYKQGDTLVPGEDGILTAGNDGDLVLQVAKEFTLPDGQPALKLQVIKAIS
jgi:hypothetical protein